MAAPASRSEQSGLRAGDSTVEGVPDLEIRSVGARRKEGSLAILAITLVGARGVRDRGCLCSAKTEYVCDWV